MRPSAAGSGKLAPMDRSPVSIVAAKLRPPMLAEHMLPRTRVLDPEPPSPIALAVVVAPAGYGKTTVAAQTCAATGRPPAWLALEPGDDEPVRFWSYVAAALETVGVGAGTTREALNRGPDHLADATVALRAAVESRGERIDLVLDDLHLIEDERILASLTDLLRHPIASLRIIATSRQELALPVGRLRSQGLLQEARVDELAFDATEAAELLATTFHLDDIEEEQLAKVHARTEGWPVGLYLAGIALRDSPDRDHQIERFAGDTRHLDEYLRSEVLAELDDDTRAFALATSVVSILDPDLCDHLTGHPGSLSLLRRLLDANVFISALDESATMFRYHPLFRDNLLSTLTEEHPELVIELHTRASRWFERAGHNDGAITHAAAAGDLDRARDLIVGSWVDLASAGAGAFTTQERWIALLGDRAHRDPQVAALMAWGLLNLGRHDEIDAWLGDALRAGAGDPDEIRLITVQSGSIGAHRGRHLGDVGEMVAGAELAMTHAYFDLEPQPGQPVSMQIGATGSALAVAAAAAYWTGDIDAAHDRAVEAVTHARATGEPSALVIGYAYLALAALERGQCEEAMAHADQALTFITDESVERFHRPTLVHVVRATCLRLRGRLAEALDAIEHAARLEDGPGERLHRAVTAIERSRILHASGDRTGARAALRSARSIADACPDARLDERIRDAENAIRFTVTDLVEPGTGVPIGVRELTEKELAVLALLPHRLTRKELASQLHVSENTIKTHLTSIRHKLAVPGRGDLVARARELGLVT